MDTSQTEEFFRSLLARVRWLSGHADQAVATAGLSVEKAEILNFPILTFESRVAEAFVHVWRKDWSSASASIDRLFSDRVSSSVVPFAWLAVGLRGELALGCEQIETGLALLRDCLATPRADRLEIWKPVFVGALCRGLAAQKQFTEALETIDRELAEIGGDLCFYLPELLRVKGHILTLTPGSDLSGAEDCFRHSLTLAGSQSALSWELRAATDLARLWRTQGRHKEARGILEPVLREFTEGFQTADLRAAEAELRSVVV